ncbi:MAG: DUF3568 family protein [Puniceicoccaceae bacterium]|nr:MAG: DUF3568 family protein [Puniceicoccaceae bacterium]
MKITMRSLLLALLLPFSALFLTGCIAVVAGGVAAGGTAYVLGDLTTPVQATPEQLEQAIQKGGRDMGLQYIRGAGDETAGEYRFRNAEDRRITVKYSRKSPVFLEMSIRVGTFGDEAISRSLEEAILKHL